MNHALLGILEITLYSAQHPSYEHQRLTVPAVALPLKIFTASAPIVPTGVKTYPATYAHGYLTFSNGSVIGQSVPAGFMIDNAVTDSAVYVSPATADGFGTSTVPAHLLTSCINKSTLSINEVVGSSLFIRNLKPFTGGRPAYSVSFITSQDRHTALEHARQSVAMRITGFHYPCKEDFFPTSGKVNITWRCQFLTYHIPTDLHVSNVQLIGTHFLLSVWYIAHPKHIWVK